MANHPSQFRTHLSTLKLAGFRNYEALSLALDERSVIVTGPNGAGKTNLLEAVSFLSPGRGLRRAALDEVAHRPGNGSWAVAATILNSSGHVDLGTGIALDPDGPQSRRTIRVNRMPARSSESLLEHVRVTWLTPSMDGLFTGSAADRRRFLDRAVMAIDRQHGSRVNAFERAMRGRNRLLADQNPDPAWLTAIETEMAELAVAIAAARREWVGLAADLIAKNGANSAFPAADIALDGVIECDFDGRSAGDVEDHYRTALAARRSRDAAAGRTLCGPHRSDLEVRHRPKDAPAELCSTGEQKALLIGLVLVQARLAARLSNETPIVLLDEVAAHLDKARRHALFQILDDLGCQSIMTGTDPEVFAALGPSVQSLAVEDGRIRRIGD